MKRLVIPAALLCALPATGDQTELPSPVRDVLTPLDALPTRSDVDNAFMPSEALDNLVVIARDPAMDLGVQLHAIRVLPQYCVGGCGVGTQVHDTLIAIINDYVTTLSLTPPTPLPPKEQLRLRAAVEALGATHTALVGDAELLTMSALLDHESRDVRVTVVRALRNLNSCAAVPPLRVRNSTESNPQVRGAILAALQTFARCQ